MDNPFTTDPSSDLYDDQSPKDAAVSVAVMIAMAAILLTVFKKSGFRAMVAVGRS